MFVLKIIHHWWILGISKSHTHTHIYIHVHIYIYICTYIYIYPKLLGYVQLVHMSIFHCSKTQGQHEVPRFRFWRLARCWLSGCDGSGEDASVAARKSAGHWVELWIRAVVRCFFGPSQVGELFNMACYWVLAHDIKETSKTKCLIQRWWIILIHYGWHGCRVAEVLGHGWQCTMQLWLPDWWHRSNMHPLTMWGVILQIGLYLYEYGIVEFTNTIVVNSHSYGKSLFIGGKSIINDNHDHFE